MDDEAKRKKGERAMEGANKRAWSWRGLGPWGGGEKKELPCCLGQVKLNGP